LHQQVKAPGGTEAKGAPVPDLSTSPRTGIDGSGRRTQKRAEAEVRRKSYAAKKPLEDKRQKLEKEMAVLNREKSDIETWLAQEDAYAEENKTLMLDFLKRQGEVSDSIAALEWQWLDVQQKLEEATT